MVVVGGGWFTVDVVGGLKPRVIPGPGKVGASAACEAAADFLSFSWCALALARFLACCAGPR